MRLRQQLPFTRIPCKSATFSELLVLLSVNFTYFREDFFRLFLRLELREAFRLPNACHLRLPLKTFDLPHLHLRALAFKSRSVAPPRLGVFALIPRSRFPLFFNYSFDNNSNSDIILPRLSASPHSPKEVEVMAARRRSARSLFDISAKPGGVRCWIHNLRFGLAQSENCPQTAL